MGGCGGGNGFAAAVFFFVKELDLDFEFDCSRCCLLPSMPMLLLRAACEERRLLFFSLPLSVWEDAHKPMSMDTASAVLRHGREGEGKGRRLFFCCCWLGGCVDVVLCCIPFHNKVSIRFEK